MGKPRRTKDGVPIRFVFLDESGHPFYDEDGPGQFVMSAVIVDDPSDAFTIIDGDSRNDKGRTMTGEYKHSHAPRSRNQQIIERMEDDGMITLVTSESIRNPADYPPENAPTIYRGVLSRMLANVARIGRPGIYRIRLDESEYLDESDLLLLSEAAFAGYDDKELAKHSPVRMYDSEFCVPIQLADTTVGEYRKALMKGEAEEYAQKRKIILVNRKPRKVWASPTPSNSMEDRRIRMIKSRGGEPHPSESQEPGSLRPVKKHWWSRI